MTAAVLELTNGSAPSSPASGLIDVYATTNKALAYINENGLILTAPTIRENETLAVQPQFAAGNNATQTGATSSELMMGLGLVSGFSITPQVTGRIAVWVGGIATNGTTADGANIKGRWGTGTAPSNAAAASGTQFGALQHWLNGTGVGQSGFIVMDKITGLTLNTAIWIDLSLIQVTGGTATVKDVQCIAFEY